MPIGLSLTCRTPLTRAVLAERGSVDAIKSVRRFLHGHGHKLDADSLLNEIPAEAGVAAITRRLMTAVDGLRAPPFDVMLPPH